MWGCRVGPALAASGTDDMSPAADTASYGADILEVEAACLEEVVDREDIPLVVHQEDQAVRNETYCAMVMSSSGMLVRLAADVDAIPRKKFLEVLQGKSRQMALEQSLTLSQLEFDALGISLGVSVCLS